MCWSNDTVSDPTASDACAVLGTVKSNYRMVACVAWEGPARR